MQVYRVSIAATVLF